MPVELQRLVRSLARLSSITKCALYLEVDADRGYEVAVEERVVVEAHKQTRLAYARVAYHHYLPAPPPPPPHSNESKNARGKCI